MATDPLLQPLSTQPHEKLRQVVAAEVIEGNFQIKF